MLLFNLYKRKMEESDVPGGAGEGNPPATGVDPAQFEALVKTVGTLAQGMGSVQAGLTALSDMESRRQTPADDDDEEEEDLGDLETMSRADLVSTILKTVEKGIDKKLSAVSEKIEGLGNDLESRDIKSEVNTLASDNKDFWDWKEEIRSIAAETPGISVARAYKLARTENPEKAKKLDEKYEPKEEDKKKTGFGGLTPTSSRTGETTKMDKTSAAEAAWLDTMGELDEALVGEGN